MQLIQIHIHKINTMYNKLISLLEVTNQAPIKKQNPKINIQVPRLVFLSV